MLVFFLLCSVATVSSSLLNYIYDISLKQRVFIYPVIKMGGITIVQVHCLERESRNFR